MLCVKAPVRLQGGIFQWRRAVLGEIRRPATLSLCFLSWCGSLPGVHSGQVGAGGARRNFWSDPGDWVTARVRGGPSTNTVPQSQACRGGGGGEPAFGKAHGPPPHPRHPVLSGKQHNHSVQRPAASLPGCVPLGPPVTSGFTSGK